MARPTFTPTPTGENGTPAVEGNPSQPGSAGSEVGAQNQGQAALPAVETSDDKLTPALERALEAIERKRQQADDKRAAHINQRVTQVLDAIKVLNLPKEQEERIIEQAKSLAATDDILPNSQQAGAGQVPPSSEEGSDKGKPQDPIEAAAYEVMDDEGMEIDEADPESKLIKWTSKAEARRTTIEALAAKRKRLANGALPLGGGQAGRPGHFGRPAKETLDNYFNSVIPKG